MERHEFARCLERSLIRLGVDYAGLADVRDHSVGGSVGRIVIDEREPGRFMSALAAAAASNADVFLGDPGWSVAQRAELAALPLDHARPAGAAGRGWLMIPSGGTGGRLKFARHDPSTIAAAVEGFRRHFGVERVNAIGVLPLHHVSGLMAWMRSALTGGEHVVWNWKDLEAGSISPAAREGDWFISLVPTQLQRLLESPRTVAWLRGFRAIFVGGGPAWPRLLDSAAAERLPVSVSYGMTETAAMVAALPPRDFLAGDRTCGPALPHARIAVGTDGVLRLGGDSIFRGYFPAWCEGDEFETEDIGAIDARGHLTILGRRDAVIISGGKKVHPAEVEAALRASGEFGEVAVIGMPDAVWGEAVVACYPAGGAAPNIVRACERLAGHQRPKRFVAVPDWPGSAQGKVNRAALREHVLKQDSKTALS